MKKPRLGELGEEIAPPLGVLYLAGALRNRFPDIDITVLDGLRVGFQESWKVIDDVAPDFLGLSFYTTSAEGAYELARRTKRHFPQTIVVAGGPHATALPEESLRTGAIDVVVRGEGEITLCELVDLWLSRGADWQLDCGKVDGLALLADHGSVVTTKPRAHITPLDALPFPARDLIEMDAYRGFYLSKARPETSMVMSRGCPFSCTFCSNAVWKLSKPLVRMRSPENVVSEMKQLRTAFGIREVFDHADEFNSDVAAGEAIAKALRKSDLGLYWKTQVRAYPLPPRLVKAMAEAGCWYVHLGIESGNGATLKGIGKHVTTEQVRDACKILKDHGIRVHGLFMLFNVWEENGEVRFEGVEETHHTLAFADELASHGLLDYMGWSVTTPYPGSKLYDIALRHDLIKPHLRGAWEKWLLEETFVMQLPGLSDHDMARAKSKGSLLRAKLLLRSGHVNPRELGYIARKGLKLIGNELKAFKKGH